MLSNKQLFDEATYIINGATIEETAEHFKVSPRTIQLHMNKALEEKANTNDNSDGINWHELYDSVLLAKETSQQKGRIKGGSIGVRTSAWSEEEAEQLAHYIIANGLTLIEATAVLEKRFGEKYHEMPKSTLYDILSRVDNPELLDELKIHFENNRHGSKGIQTDSFSTKYTSK